MRNFIVKHIGSIAIFSILLWIGVNLQTLWGPIKRRGFHCEDKSIREPYLKNTITPTELYLIGLYLPLGVMLVNEYVQLRWIRRSANHSDSQEFRGYFSSLWPAIMPFLCGFATERFLKSIAKFSVARLRPHFYTVCRPITLNGVACEDEFSVPFYVSEYKCTAQGNMSESLFKSFPSGHSSLSFYGLMYTAIYLQRFAKTGGAIYGPLVHVMQLLCLILACIVGVSRVLDFRHFWSDVFAGALLGSITAVAFSLYRERYMQHFEQFLQKREKGESQRDLEESSESIVAEEVVRNDKRKADQSTIEIGDA